MQREVRLGTLLWVGLGLGIPGYLTAQTETRTPSQKATIETKPTLSAPRAALVTFCLDQLGQRVGTGECCDLVRHGLAAIGALTRWPDAPEEGDFVWGVFVCSVEARDGQHLTQVGKAGGNGRVRPGDVIQFKDVRFEGQRGNGTYWLTYPHYTAVVEQVSKDGTYCQVLHQNSSAAGTVEETVLSIPDLTQGWMRFYRPVGRNGQPLVGPEPEPTEPSATNASEPHTSKVSPPSSKKPKRSQTKTNKVAKRSAKKQARHAH